MNLYEALGSDDDVHRDKVVLVGNPGVGKSTIFQRFKTGRFVHEQELTHHDKEGQEYRKVWRVGEQEVSMTLFDTAGVERYTQTIPPTYYRRAKVVLLVYSIDNSDSFQAISSNWLENMYSAADESSLTVLVGNKCDLESNQEDVEDEIVSRRRALTLAENHGIKMDLVFHISARTGSGFQEMFDLLALKMVEMGPKSPSTSDQQTLGSSKPKNNKCTC